MSFAAPLLLWSLVALVPLAAIYLLKVRPRRRATTALFLWQQILEQRRAQHLWHRLRDVWSLLLMLLAFSAIALAMAGPRWSSAKRQDLLVLIDTSASMQAQDGRTTRLERAQQKARELARAMDGVERVALGTIDDDLQFLSHLTDNPREILGAIDEVEPSVAGLNTAALPRRTETADDWRSCRVVLISDGAFEPSKLPAHVELIRVGEPQENIGIVAADLAFHPANVDELSLFVRLASSATATRECDLVISQLSEAGDVLKKVIPLTIEPGLSEPQVFSIEGGAPGRWIARLEVEDALAQDDAAYLVARRPPPIRVSVESDDRYFLEQSVSAFARGATRLELVSDDAQVVLAEGRGPDAPRAIVLGPRGDSRWWESVGEEIEVSAPRVLVEDHPALRHIDLSTIAFVGARQLTPPEGSQVLVDSSDGVPLIYVTHQQGQALVVNLDPLDAEFYYSAWFPVLVHSGATHLVGREEPLRAVYSTSDAYALPRQQSSHAARITPASLQLGGGEPAGDALGFYDLQTDAERETIARSLLSVEETLLNGRGDATSHETPLPSGHPLSYWLTALAIVVVSVESVLYHRRKVG